MGSSSLKAAENRGKNAEVVATISDWVSVYIGLYYRPCRNVVSSNPEQDKKQSDYDLFQNVEAVNHNIQDSAFERRKATLPRALKPLFYLVFLATTLENRPVPVGENLHCTPKLSPNHGL